ncbi:MAG TPA: ABC transporter substrate-binding protein, partial [Pyrinomonadaceae bacterium]|nr:ABC transporter substrate-binding protein [Pyrinomonadaceae bacterium]
MKRVNRIERCLIVSLLFALACGASCRRNASPQASAPNAPQYTRIISLSPSTTEVLYGLGLFPRVVAVSDYDEFPPEVKQLPRIGGWSNTSLEQVTALHPDLIVMTESQAPLIKDKFDALGVKTIVVPSYTLEDVFAGIAQLGRETGRDAQAQQLINETQAKLENVRTRTRDLPRLRVLCIVDRVPGTLRDLYAATRGSFIVQLIE